jgi:cytochrome b6-f complex iron-sulfur subunit
MGCDGNCMNRRTFVKVGVGGLIIAGSAGLYGSLRSLTPVVSYEPARILEIGSPQDFLNISMADFQVADRKVSVIKGEDGLYALIRNCTHMGCIPNYSENDGQYLCPCHGSVFTLEGDVVRGPAPEPLFRASLIVNSRGAVEINTSLAENDPVRRLKQPFLLEV